ncbi:hypothetical protein DKX38_012609 [Salix brachista]|uniref:Uncharacterized protein n=1 Tax=Salix brachista TaxID=2182728 RepID=A0A5N5LP39_9ROSI|nr:hypothetical protein DKX38_012609 [Salix brachista]
MESRRMQINIRTGISYQDRNFVDDACFGWPEMATANYLTSPLLCFDPKAKWMLVQCPLRIYSRSQTKTLNTNKQFQIVTMSNTLLIELGGIRDRSVLLEGGFDGYFSSSVALLSSKTYHKYCIEYTQWMRKLKFSADVNDFITQLYG